MVHSADWQCLLADRKDLVRLILVEKMNGFVDESIQPLLYDDIWVLIICAVLTDWVYDM